MQDDEDHICNKQHFYCFIAGTYLKVELIRTVVVTMPNIIPNTTLEMLFRKISIYCFRMIRMIIRRNALGVKLNKHD